MSGSGAATTVSVGSVAWPILRRAGYPAEHAGGMLAAAGIGAILSPLTFGAAAFIIAGYLQVSYLKVLLWAIIPTLLYYLGILLAVEIDARRLGATAVDVTTVSPWRLLGRFGYHFISLAVIVLFLALDIPPFTAVVYACGVQLVLSFLDRRHALTPDRLYTALATRVRSVLPVTASFIIAWVIIGPALKSLGVAPPEAAMFLFYFVVLSEVTPPTALAAVAASAITGGRMMATMMQAAKYALPAFLVPFAFVLTGNGAALLTIGSPWTILWTAATSALAVAALAVATGGWLIRRAGWMERALCLLGTLLLLYLEPATIAAGAALLVAAIVIHLVTSRTPATTGRIDGEPVI